VVEDGILQLGVNSRQLATLSTDNNVIFGPDILRPLPAASGGVLSASIEVKSGTAQNDQLLYGSGDVDITKLKELRVDVLQSNTANEIDGKSFTIVAAQNGAVAGTIQRSSQTIDVVEGGNVPALVDFTVVDLNTSGKPDITLLADSDLAHLSKHSSLVSRNHKSSAALLTNAAKAGHAQTINSLNSLTNAQVDPHLNTIHPEPYSSYMTVSLENADLAINTVLDHASKVRGFSNGNVQEVEDNISGSRLWLAMNYHEGDIDGDNDLGDFSYNLSSIIMGKDFSASTEQTIGAYFSFSQLDMNEHDNADQDFDGEAYHLGTYYNHANIKGWDFRGVAGYSYANHDSERQVTLSNSKSKASASFDSHSFYVGVASAISVFKNGWVDLSPELGFKYIYYTQESIKESENTGLGLNIDSADAQAVVASAGLNAHFASLGKSSLYPMAFLRFEHDFYANSNSEHEIDAALQANPNSSQKFVGQNRGENSVIAGVGLGSDLSSALSVRGSLEAVEHSNGSEWGGSLYLEYQW
jgi:hypothetical protein